MSVIKSFLAYKFVAEPTCKSDNRSVLGIGGHPTLCSIPKIVRSIANDSTMTMIDSTYKHGKLCEEGFSNHSLKAKVYI